MQLLLLKGDIRSDSMAGLEKLKAQLLQFSLFNFLLVAVLGLFLRSLNITSIPVNYKYILHAHSHFAFGGWVFPILVWMIIHYFPSVAEKAGEKHCRNIIWLILFSAYGMLLSFPMQGYGPVSITFSTVSVLAGFYLSLIIWKATSGIPKSTSIKFLRASLFYLVLSSIGPFATGPIVAMGKSGSPLYFNAIYFYLHFQYNGWFTFMVLAVLTRKMEVQCITSRLNRTFYLMNLAIFPTYFLSTLWNHPHSSFYIIGGLGGAIQLVAIIYVLEVFSKLKFEVLLIKRMILLCMLALCLKAILQFLSAFPFFADMAYTNRNFIIAYLHLVLLGFVSMFAFTSILETKPCLLNPVLKTAGSVFIFTFIVTEMLLVIQAFGGYFNYYIPDFSIILFCCSVFFIPPALVFYLQLKFS